MLLTHKGTGLNLLTKIRTDCRLTFTLSRLWNQFTMFCLSQVRTQPITLKSLQYSCQGARQYELANRFVTDLADMRWQLDDLRQPVVLASYKSTYPVPQQIVNGALVTAYATSEGLAAPATKNLCKKKLKR